MISVILPAVLLLLSFFVKMTIEREVDLPKALQSIIELPTDIMFLSSTLVIAFILSNPDELEYGILYFISCIALSLFVVFLWRKAEKELSKKTYHTIWISFFGYLISIPILYFSVIINIPVAAGV